ncbi:hypothetical protein FRC05_008612 [Tulasnella sp. 425]|nr:hypothetical protein FRC05_008612 [Tulasnella sp. 425]
MLAAHLVFSHVDSLQHDVPFNDQSLGRLASPPPSSAAAISPKPARKKKSFADYAKQRKARAAEEQKKRAKGMEKEPSGASGSGALALVLESTQRGKPGNAAPDVSSG